MATNDTSQLRDAQGGLIAQVWNAATGAFMARLGNAKGAFNVSPPLVSANLSKNVTASTQLLPADSTRVRYVVQNNGTVNIQMTWGGGVTSGSVNNLILKPGEIYHGGADSELVAVMSADGTTSCPVFCRSW
jgi:hypothetical protein